MASVSSVGGFLDKLVALLKARSALEGVKVFSGPVDDLSAGTEAIILGTEPIEPECDYDTLPKLEIRESYDVVGLIPGIEAFGADEEVIKAARDRVLEILAEILVQLGASNGTIAETQVALGVDDARITTWRLDQAVGDSVRLAAIRFVIAVKAHYIPA